MLFFLPNAATGDDKKKGSKWDNMEPKQQGVVTVVTGTYFLLINWYSFLLTNIYFSLPNLFPFIKLLFQGNAPSLAGASATTTNPYPLSNFLICWDFYKWLK